MLFLESFYKNVTSEYLANTFLHMYIQYSPAYIYVQNLYYAIYKFYMYKLYIYF